MWREVPSRTPRSEMLGLAIYGGHHDGLIAVARGCARREGGVDFRKLAVRQNHIGRAGVLLEILATLGAEERHDVLALREQPSERELGRRDFLCSCQLAHL